MNFSKVFFEVRDDLGHLVINDPPANKMTSVFLEEFFRLVTQQIARTKVRGMMIYGTGRHFSSGAEVDRLRERVASQIKREGEAESTGAPEGHRQDRSALDFFSDLEIPVVSAINGFCIGSGLELALCSHIRICGTGSTLGLPESTFGIVPALGGTLRSLELCGLGKALEMVLSGRTYTAEEALQMGIVDGIVSKKETLGYCERLLQFILQSETPYLKRNARQYVKEFQQKYPAPANP